MQWDVRPEAERTYCLPQAQNLIAAHKKCLQRTTVTLLEILLKKRRLAWSLCWNRLLIPPLHHPIKAFPSRSPSLSFLCVAGRALPNLACRDCWGGGGERELIHSTAKERGILLLWLFHNYTLSRPDFFHKYDNLVGFYYFLDPADKQ
jgi:hypothetical protein